MNDTKTPKVIQLTLYITPFLKPFNQYIFVNKGCE